MTALSYYNNKDKKKEAAASCTESMRDNLKVIDCSNVSTTTTTKVANYKRPTYEELEREYDEKIKQLQAIEKSNEEMNKKNLILSAQVEAKEREFANRERIRGNNRRTMQAALGGRDWKNNGHDHNKGYDWHEPWMDNL